MPQKQLHPGAAVMPIPLSSPAMRGLNTEASSTLLSSEWATVLNNVIFDSNGRAAIRKGFTSQTDTPAAGVIMRVHEYVKADGTTQTISSTDADIFKTASAPTTVEGSLTITEGNIKFVNFNDKCIALGTGTSSNPSVYTGTGDFTTVSVASGQAPTGGVGTAAFGRLWVLDSDGHTIRFCALLDETKWHTDDGGGWIDMARVWPSGQDTVTAIEEFAGDLVIFGKHNTVIWTDGAGSDIGLNPSNIYVSDTIPGTGCVSQFAITRALGDVFFLSQSGLQALSRALQDKTTPTTNVSRHVQSTTLAYLTAESDKDDITVLYSPVEDFVLVVFPQSNKVKCFDTRNPMEDGSYRSTEWSTTLQTATYFTSDQQVYGSFTGVVGEIMKHADFNDDGLSYDFTYQSGWLDFGELNQYLKFVKRLTSFMFVGTDTQVNFTLNYDFDTNAFNEVISAAGSQGSEFNISEFTGGGSGLGYIIPTAPANALKETEFGGSIALRKLTVPGKSGGQYVKVGCTLSTAKGNFALQSINLFAKIGRIA